MNFFAILLLLLGLFLVLLEFYLPGAIMGTLGAILILASVIEFASTSTHPVEVLLFIVAAFVGIVGVIRFAVWQIPRTKKKASIYLGTDQEGYQASSFDPNAVGKKGEALTDLKPGGYVLIDGKKHQALSLTGYVTKGSRIIVVSGQEESLIVKIIKEELT
jgi:membrane-bound serine protease (ClpP class)